MKIFIAFFRPAGYLLTMNKTTTTAAGIVNSLSLTANSYVCIELALEDMIRKTFQNRHITRGLEASLRASHFQTVRSIVRGRVTALRELRASVLSVRHADGTCIPL
jgi:hypothetical protein